MLNTTTKRDIIKDLDEMFNVQDVYFNKGILYVINSYDIPSVEEYLDEERIDVEIRLVDEQGQWEF